LTVAFKYHIFIPILYHMYTRFSGAFVLKKVHLLTRDLRLDLEQTFHALRTFLIEQLLELIYRYIRHFSLFVSRLCFGSWEPCRWNQERNQHTCSSSCNGE
jgi:hypothetical protein